MLAADAHSTRDPCWADEFFGEEHVVSTFQHLLHDSPKNVEDLSRLCIAAREDSVVLAFNIHGLMPFANNTEFVFPFACEYAVDMYVLKIAPDNYAVDHALLIFAASCILLKGLCQTKTLTRGFYQCMLAENKELLVFHANAMLYSILNACAVRRGALREAMQLLNAHGVTVDLGA